MTNYIHFHIGMCIKIVWALKVGVAKSTPWRFIQYNQALGGGGGGESVVVVF